MSMLSQIFPPSPTFTEEHVPNLQGKVCIVTGAAVGVGYQLAKMLYAQHATVYIATRSAAKIDAAISSLRASAPSSRGVLRAMVLDLSDLATIGPAARAFLDQESRLDVLVHNAGIMTPPAGSKSKQGHDLEMATNCLGPFLLSRFLQPVQQRTASLPDASPAAVRTVWVASMLDGFSVHGGIVFGGGDGKTDSSGAPVVQSNAMDNYMQTKAGAVFLAHESAQRFPDSGVVNMSVHPGLMRTELQRHQNRIVKHAMGVVFKPAKFGAYSELFAGFSPSITAAHNGRFAIPWGRLGTVPRHIEEALKGRERGGTGASRRFWEWCEQETAPYFVQA
ncbi:hypothetical protein LMH87_000881 [Akanthomyces muscarius]|uniref:Short-chain dehydrogenase n=1 Tax=Akanthomyces muscarius TaxID=2231603 RepID=A0A9W8UPA0_AKAMU|nr:hypothetical protein LMH87_000881 [Akanthomyces muscarius]KAJ4155645.1 hypothetical protein LMH87_000881 [Akanthomyces muscarius]